MQPVQSESLCGQEWHLPDWWKRTSWVHDPLEALEMLQSLFLLEPGRLQPKLLFDALLGGSAPPANWLLRTTWPSRHPKASLELFPVSFHLQQDALKEWKTSSSLSPSLPRTPIWAIPTLLWKLASWQSSQWPCQDCHDIVLAFSNHELMGHCSQAHPNVSVRLLREAWKRKCPGVDTPFPIPWERDSIPPKWETHKGGAQLLKDLLVPLQIGAIKSSCRHQSSLLTSLWEHPH